MKGDKTGGRKAVQEKQKHPEEGSYRAGREAGSKVDGLRGGAEESAVRRNGHRGKNGERVKQKWYGKSQVVGLF